MAKYVYVDNSNVWTEGRRAAAVENDLAFDIADAIENKTFDPKWKYDFGKLLELVGGKKNGLKKGITLLITHSYFLMENFAHINKIWHPAVAFGSRC